MPVMEVGEIFRVLERVYLFIGPFFFSFALADMRIPILFRSASRFGGGRGGLDKRKMDGFMAASWCCVSPASIIRWCGARIFRMQELSSGQR